jgi:hypothetical protein
MLKYFQVLSFGNIKSPPFHSLNGTSQQKTIFIIITIYIISTNSIEFMAHIPNTLNNFLIRDP